MDTVRVPVILAGGLSPENVRDAIRAVRPWGVDSLTHTNRPLPDGGFRKDIDRVAAFVARRAAPRPVVARGGPDAAAWPRRRSSSLGDSTRPRRSSSPTARPGRRGSGSCGEPRLTGGGTAGNTAAALARLGVPVVFHGAVGDDGFGRWLAEELRASGVGHARPRGHCATMPTCQVIAMLEPDGERYLVVWPHDMGALARLSPADVDAALVGGAAWLHTTGMCLRQEPVASAVLEACASRAPRACRSRWT